MPGGDGDRVSNVDGSRAIVRSQIISYIYIYIRSAFYVFL